MLIKNFISNFVKDKLTRIFMVILSQNNYTPSRAFVDLNNMIVYNQNNLSIGKRS